MTHARQELGCGRVEVPGSGKVEVVVAGGWDVEDGSTEILDVKTRTWRMGPKLPIPLRAAASVQYKVRLAELTWYGGILP